VNGTDLGIIALTGIAIASLITSLVAILAIRRWSDQDAVLRAKSEAQAHLLELRLFMDDPVQILRSQRELVVAQARVIKLLMPPLLILAVPMAMVFWMLDALYGRAPLRVGEPAVVLAKARPNSIRAPEAVLIETKPLFIQSTGETAWRIRPVRPVTGTILVSDLRAKLVAGSGIAYLPKPLADPDGVHIQYPPATVFGFHWVVWFLLLSAINALVFRHVLRVVF
jgi:uncharacterized membrane protein (DUF106 family)